MSKSDLNPIDAQSTHRNSTNPVKLVVEPPIAVDVQDLDERLSRLALVVEDRVIPKLLGLYEGMPSTPRELGLGIGSKEVGELSRLVIGPDNTDASDYILTLKDSGVSIDTLHLELLEPTARHLGDLWAEDKVDFIDVTIGVKRLQQLVHVFAGLDQIPDYDDRRRALIVSTPGEKHSFGNSMVQRFFRSSGWFVYSCPGADIQQVAELAAQEWIGIVGFSLSNDKHIASLTNAIEGVRKMSMNRTVGIIVGGPALNEKPDLAFEVGADGTAVNAPAAVILAKKLLVPSLVTAH